MKMVAFLMSFYPGVPQDVTGGPWPISKEAAT